MPKNITSSVGRGGRNFPPLDVMTVQYLLNCVPAPQGGASPELVVDGGMGPKTIAAIEKFQRANGGFADGRVDPGGNTLRALQTKAKDPYPNQPITAGAAPGGGNPSGQQGVKQSPNDPFGQKGGGQQGIKQSPNDPFAQKGFGQQGIKQGPTDPFGQKGFGGGANIN